MTNLPKLPAPSNYDISEKSSETMTWLRDNIKVGYTDERGPAWWAAGATTKDGTWVGIPDGSHFPQAIPADVVVAQLDFRIVEGVLHATYEDENGDKQVADDDTRKVIVNQRTGQIMGTPRAGYKIHGYEEWTLHQISKIIDQSSGELGVSTVGLLKKGGVAFLQARLPQLFEVEGFGYLPYITAATSCDQSLASTYFTGVLGTVCDNTLTNGLSHASSKLKIKHSSGSAGRTGEIRDALGLVFRAAEDFDAQARQLLSVEVDDKQFARWLDEYAPMPEAKDEVSKTTGRKLGPGRGYTIAEAKRDELTRLYTKDAKVAPWTNTAFGVVQAANTFNTWERTVQSASGGRLERNLTNDVVGTTFEDDQATLDALARALENEMVFAT